MTTIGLIGLAVFVAGAVFSDLEADPVEFGLLVGVLAGFLALAGTGVRAVINGIVKGMRE